MSTQIKNLRLIKFSLSVLFILCGSIIFASKSEAAITYRSAATSTLSLSTTLTINKPAGTVQNDVMIAAITINPNGAFTASFTPPAGWTQIQQSTNTTGTYYPNTVMFYKVAGASEGASYAWTISRSSYGGGWIASFAGVDTTNPIDTNNMQTVGTSSSPTTSYTTPSINTSFNNDMLVITYGGNSSGSQTSWSTPTGASAITSSVWFSGTVTSSSGFYQSQAVAGSTGNIASTAQSTYGNSGIVALAPSGNGTFSANGSGANGSNQTFTAINTGKYRILAKGASGGYNTAYPSFSGGAGASIQGDVYLTAGEVLNIRVGQAGGNGTGGAGGGGSFVVKSTGNIPLIIAGGGGGAHQQNGNPGDSTNNGKPNGGIGYSYGSGGGGLQTDGTIGGSAGGTGITAPLSFINGSSGGASNTGGTAIGGYGGGGGAHSGCGGGCGAGGGGGYNGGNAQAYYGEGGGSFNAGVNQANTSGANTGNGSVSISYLGGTAGPLVVSPTQSSISYNTATLGGNVTSDGGSAISGRGVCVSTSANPAIGGTCFSTSGTTGVFTVGASSLSTNTFYYYRAYATNANGTTYSENDTFTTLANAAPTVASPTSASITGNSATLGGNVTSQGTQSITERGVCVGTSANPAVGGNCFPTAGTTGVFTISATGLTPNTLYHYRAYATNSVGTGYTSDTTFSTLDVAPTTVGTAANGTPQSYFVTLNGSANPNGSQTYGHFRLFTTAQNPGNCNTDSGGIRFPAGTVNFPDLDLGAGTSVVSAPTFSYTIPYNSGTFLTPNTTYYYCAYAVNTVNSTQYTTGGSSLVSFTTPDGPASPCDAPASGDLTIPSGAACVFNGLVNGVDSGTGSRNTAVLSVGAGVSLSVSAGQKIAYGSLVLGRGSILTLARGASLVGGGVYVHDNDRDNYLDDATQYVGSTASAATEFIRRTTISSVFNYSWKIASPGATYDCNKNSAYAYQIMPNLVRDADHDGYKTATAAGPQCVGASSIINGRLYFNDGSGPN